MGNAAQTFFFQGFLVENLSENQKFRILPKAPPKSILVIY